jgi:DNA-binding NarL/FixJ family response regulator
VVHDLETDIHRSLSPAMQLNLDGAEFGAPEVILPSVEQPIAPAVNIKSEGPAITQPETLRILIADDVASTRCFLRAVLEHCKEFEVVGEASDGDSAIEMAESLQPDLVLLDLSMPLVDGASALSGIRELAPSASVIIVSGMSPSLGAELLNAGATAFLPKGIAPFELLDRLGDILDRSLSVEGRTGRDVVHADQRAVVCLEDPQTRHRVTEVLESCHVSVTLEANTPSIMLQVIGLVKPEIVVLDLFVNGEPDTSVVTEICDRSSESAVIVYSMLEELKDEALAAGATAFVPRPRIDELAEQVQRVIASR